MKSVSQGHYLTLELIHIPTDGPALRQIHIPALPDFIQETFLVFAKLGFNLAEYLL